LFASCHAKVTSKCAPQKNSRKFEKKTAKKKIDKETETGQKGTAYN